MNTDDIQIADLLADLYVRVNELEQECHSLKWQEHTFVNKDQIEEIARRVEISITEHLRAQIKARA